MITPNLPPLPARSEFTSLWEYTDGQMQAYALAAYQSGFNAALEQVKAKVETMKKETRQE